MQKRHRIFIAVNLPEDIKRYLSGFEKKLAGLPANWIKKDNIHITLLFLGSLTDIEIGEVCLALKDISKNYQSFDLNINKVCYGPENKLPPKMVWSNIEKSKELSILKKEIQKLLSEKITFPADNKSFSPHITLAKVRTFEWRSINSEELPEVEENVELSFPVDSIEVMESSPSKGGPYYTVVESFPLLD